MLLCLAVAGLGAGAHAQLVDVASIQAIPTDMKVERAYISPAGDYLVVAELGHQGLKQIDVATGDVTLLAPEASAFGVTFSANGGNVVYRENSFKDNRRYTAVKSYDRTTGRTTTLVKPTRDLQGVAVEGNTAVTVNSGRSAARALDGAGMTLTRPVFSIDRGMLYKTVDGRTTAFSPLGEGSFSYLWPSLSPDGTKVVFYAAGYGAYTCNLDGSNLTSIGQFRAPVWLNDNVVVAMADENDGVTTTKSTIVAISADGTTTQTLTDDSVVAMLPAVAGNNIVFTSVEGGLYTITLK